MLRLWPRTILHIGWADLAAGALACAVGGDRNRLLQQVESYWPQEEAIACFSVRSGLDLLIQAMDLQPGDEILYSALNIKGMVNVAKRSELVPVPLDFDTATLTPTVETLKKAITPKSKILVVAPLFGSRLDLDKLVDAAHGAGLLVVEDCAQAFCGQEYSGHPRADVTMFSFGPLKTSTALGGALVNVRDLALRSRMREIQAAYPVQPTGKQAKRVIQFALLKLVTLPLVFGSAHKIYALFGKEFEDAVVEQARNVAVLKKTNNLRFRLSTALLALLRRRLEQFDKVSSEQRMAKGSRLAELLDGAFELPATNTPYLDYWQFAVLVGSVGDFIAHMRKHGFDAANLPRSQPVAPPEDRPELSPRNAADLLNRLVIVPCYATLPDRELQRMANVAKDYAREVSTSARQQIDQEVDAAQSNSTSLRRNRRKLVKQFGKNVIRRLRTFLSNQSLASNSPVMDAKEFPSLGPLSENWTVVREELDGILEHKDAIPAFEDLSSDQKRIAKGRQWRTFILFGFGEKSIKNCAFAPRTTELLEEISGLQSAWFSILEPGYHIPPHRGITKGILRCHLGLIVPDDEENCWMRVDQDKHCWREGELLVFDDTYLHEVRNDTPQERVVLLLDFERPMRFWGTLANRTFIRLLKLTAYYKEPKRKLLSYEDQFEAAVRRADRLMEGPAK